MPFTIKRPTDLIIGRGILTAEAIASELRDRLTRELGDYWRFLPTVTLLEQARRILSQFEPILAEAFHATDLAGFLAGFNEVAKKLPPDIESLFGRLIGGPPRPPGGLILPAGFGGDEPIVRFPLIERAAESLLRRNILSRAQFDQADAAARANAFAVAGDLSEDTLETIRDVLSETVYEGASLDAFRENLGGRLRGSFAGPGHLENVFRTNVQAAFTTGHDELAGDPIVAELFPFARYDAIHDARCRPTHLALESLGLNGTNVYWAADPFWDVFAIPWDYQCRCSKTMLTIEAAARRGVRAAAEWLRTGRRPPQESMLPKIPFRPPAGFGSRQRVAA